MKRVTKKIQNQIGTSLVELLATVVLLGIMGVALTAGVSTIQRTYNQIVRKANEQTLLSTTLIEMRNLIRKSVDYDQETKRFKSEEGYWFAFENNTEKSGIQIVYYMDNKPGTGKTGDPHPLLIQEQGKVSGIYSRFGTDGGVIYDSVKNVFEIKNLEVGDDGDNPTRLDSYYVRQIVKRTGGSE